MKHAFRGLVAIFVVFAATPFRVPAAPIELIPLTGAVWRYNVSNLNAAAWTAPDYDESGWASGASLLAFEDNAALVPLIQTALEDPRNPVDGVAGHAYYFRIHFHWPEPTNFVTLRFACRLDDCAAIHLNGVLLTNLGVTTPGAYDSLGRGAIGTGTEAVIEETFSILPGSLRTGDNVLAVEVHQVTTTSSDIVWGARLEGEVDTTPPTVVQQIPGAGSIVSSLNAVEVVFSEPVTHVHAADLLVAGVAATNVVVLDPGHYLFECVPPPTGAVHIAFSPAQAIRDLAGFAFAGTNWSCTLDTNALSSAEGLVHRYSFTVDATDSVGSAHGQLLGSAVVSSGAAVLNGSSAYVDLPNNLVTGLTAVTFEAWVTDNGSGNWARIFDFGNNTAGEGGAGTGTQYMFLTPGPGAGVLRAAYTQNGNGSEQIVQGSAALATGTQKHVVLTTDGDTLQGRLYVDGVLVGSNDAMTLTPAAVGPTVNNWLGRSQWSADAYLNGRIHEFRIYNIALTPEEVQDNFLLGPDVASMGGPVVLKTQPRSQTVGELQPATFEVTYGGKRPVSLQWWRNGQRIPEATNAGYTLPSAALGDDGAVFRVTLTNIVNHLTCTATSSNAVLHVTPDLTPPVLVRAASLFPDGVMVELSEGVNPDTATNLANYAITGPGGPLAISSVVFSRSTSNLFLTTAPQVLGAVYTLTVSGLIDLADAGNPIAPQSQAPFTAVDYALTNIGTPAIPGSLAAADGGFDLTAGGSGISGTHDQFAFGSRVMLGNFDVQVRLDALPLTHAWTRAGLMARDGLATNAAFAASFATPGPAGCFFAARTHAGATATLQGAFPANFPDTWLRLRRTGNVFDGFASLDGHTWEHLGSATLAMASAAQVGFALSAGVTNATASARFRDDGFGSGVLATNAPLPFEPPGPCSRRTALVITEIMYNPPGAWSGTNNLEFVELWNSGLVTEDLTGHRLGGDVRYTFPPGASIAPGQYLVIAHDPAAAESFYGVPCLGPYTNSLGNNNGVLRLLNELGGRLLDIEYDNEAPWPAAPDGAGHSLVLVRPSYGEADPRGWAASDVFGGSPGRAEHHHADPARAVVINEFLANTDAPLLDYIELFNASPHLVDLSGAWLTDEPATHKFRIPDGTLLGPRGLLACTQTELGFALSADGEQILLVNSNLTRVLDAVPFEAQSTGVASGRYPDGAPGISELSAPTFQANNAPPLQRPVVINEIMYHPISDTSDDEYVELHNRGTNILSLAGWRLDGGVQFTFPADTVIAGGGYVVVARNLTNLLAHYPQLNPTNTVGNYSGALRNRGERLVLKMAERTVTTNQGILRTNIAYITVNDLTFRDGGRWGSGAAGPSWSDGGGSSLELIDPHADTRCAASWADSDESAKAAWTSLDITNVLENGQTADMIDQGGYYGTPNRFELFLQDAGEAVLDDLEFRNNSGPNLVANGSFASGTNGWTIRGTCRASFVEPGVGTGSSAALHLVASDRGDAGPNKISAPLASTLVTGPPNTGIFRGRVRWLKGSPYIMFRTRGHWMEVSRRLNVPADCGTPGLPNSRLVLNAGPVITDVAHAPVLPAAGQRVIVTARVRDPDGVGAVTLRYRIDPDTNGIPLAMTDDGAGGDALAGDGIYSAALPANAGGTLAAFHVEAVDAAGGGAASTFPARVPAYECLVRWGETPIAGSLGTYRLWVTSANVKFWTLRERNANDPIDATFVYGHARAVYNVRTLYSGSPFHSPNHNGPVGSFPCDYEVNFHPDDKFLGSEPFVLTAFDVSSANFFLTEKTGQVDLTGNWIARKLGQPFNTRRHVHVVVNGLRRGTIYDDAQQPNAEFVDMYFPDDENGELRKVEDWFEFDDDDQTQGITTATVERFAKTGGGLDTKRYRWNWRPRATDHPDQWAALTNLILAIHDTTHPHYVDRVREWVDIPNVLRPIVTHHICGDWDSYGYERGKNMYAYKPDVGPWRFLMWDIELALGADSRAATDSIYNIHDPVLRVLITNTPAFHREYLGAFLEAVHTTLAPGVADTLLDERYASLVQNQVGLNSPQSIKTYIAQRRAYLLTQLPTAAFAVNGPDFLEVATSNLCTFTGTAPLDARNLVVNGIPYPVSWTGVTTWRLAVPLSPGTNILAFAALNRFGETLPDGTRVVTAVYSGTDPDTEGGVVINEIMYHSPAEGGAYVELYNAASGYTFDLSGWQFNGLGYTFPPGTLLPPRTFLVLAQDCSAFAQVYGTSHTPFATFEGTLDPDGETLTLLKPGPTPDQDLVIDRVRYEPAAPWAAEAAGAGASLQVIDPARDNSRAGNWGSTAEWRYMTATGTANSSRLYVYLAGVGDLFIDEMKLVAGTVAEADADLLFNGDFELPLTNGWKIPTANGAMHVSATNVHTGAGSLHLVSTNPLVISTAILIQDISPALTRGQTYTLSFWYQPKPGLPNLTIRMSSGTLNSTHNPAPVLLSPGVANTVAAPLPPFPPLWLNEVQPLPTHGFLDAFGEADPWIELYNAGTNLVSLDGLHLADNYTNALQWPFPPGTTLQPSEFKIVVCDGQPEQSTPGELHAPFRLPPGTGTVALARSIETRVQLVDYLNYTAVPANASYGDVPDGQPFHRGILRDATPGAPNNAVNPAPAVYINEWMAANSGLIRDPADNDADDWFELYNPNPFAVDLGHWHLADDLANPLQDRIPNIGHYVLPPNGFLLVWADGEPGQNSTNRADLHANFNLRAAGEAIVLSAPDGTLVDAVTFGPQTANFSQGRVPDGSPTLSVQSLPTPASTNAPAPAAPVIVRLTRDTLAVVLTLATEPNFSYQVQFKTALDAPVWTPLDTYRLASGPTLDWTDTPGTNTQRFYRAVRTP
ncbi:MAG: lamin tail domain-containing protein [Verrucomicrobia bacterium]|nr:lamin tail domain-containing protein [Verrucomicrobiota bacterium]